VAGAGDVNGYDEVILGAPGDEAGESSEGMVFLFLGAPGCGDAVDNDADGLIDFDGRLSALGHVAAAPDPECTDAWHGSEAWAPTPTPIPTPTPTPLPSLVGDVPMCKSQRGREMTVPVPPSGLQRLLDKGLARGECLNPTNGRVLCKTRRGKLYHVQIGSTKSK